jgi:hypothetical protein
VACDLEPVQNEQHFGSAAEHQSKSSLGFPFNDMSCIVHPG